LPLPAHSQPVLDIKDLASLALEAVDRAHRRRMDTFLRVLDARTGASGDQRRRLAAVLSSEVGEDLLADFAETIIRTPCPTVASAFALLYADFEHAIYPLSFKRGACQALRGVTDVQIEIFLELSAQPQFRDRERKTDDPYDMHFVSQVTLANSRIAAIEPDRGSQITVTLDLVQRGLLAPEPGAGIIGDENTHGPYGISNRTLQYRGLLLTAKEQMNRSSGTIL
jgi:hypothetical protein